MHQLCTFQPQRQCHPFPNINTVAQKGVWRSSQCYMAHVENSDSLLELGISRGWGSCWVRMQLKQQRDQGDDPGNRFHHLFLLNSEKWYVSHLNITFHLLTYSQPPDLHSVAAVSKMPLIMTPHNIHTRDDDCCLDLILLYSYSLIRHCSICSVASSMPVCIHSIGCMHSYYWNKNSVTCPWCNVIKFLHFRFKVPPCIKNLHRAWSLVIIHCRNALMHLSTEYHC